MVRLGLTSPSDPTVAQSLPIVDATIKAETSTGAGFHRYNGDGYGDGASDGHPWAPSGKGAGHLWPALAGERGGNEIATGQGAAGGERLVGVVGGGPRPGVVPGAGWGPPALGGPPLWAGP